MTTNSFEIAGLPPVLLTDEVKQLFKIGKTTAYQLAAAGLIQSITIGAPGTRGKRAFLTSSLLDYVSKRVECSPKLKTKGERGKKADTEAALATA